MIVRKGLVNSEEKLGSGKKIEGLTDYVYTETLDQP